MARGRRRATDWRHDPVPVDLVLEVVDPGREVRALRVEEERPHLLAGARRRCRAAPAVGQPLVQVPERRGDRGPAGRAAAARRPRRRRRAARRPAAGRGRRASARRRRAGAGAGAGGGRRRRRRRRPAAGGVRAAPGDVRVRSSSRRSSSGVFCRSVDGAADADAVLRVGPAACGRPAGSGPAPARRAAARAAQDLRRAAANTRADPLGRGLRLRSPGRAGVCPANALTRHEDHQVDRAPRRGTPGRLVALHCLSTVYRTSTQNAMRSMPGRARRYKMLGASVTVRRSDGTKCGRSLSGSAIYGQPSGPGSRGPGPARAGRPPPRPPAADRSRTAVDERRELAAQRLLVRGGRALGLDLRAGGPVGQPVDLGLAGGEVDRDVGPRREDPELADLLGGDPAGGQVGDQARRRSAGGRWRCRPGGSGRAPHRVDLDRLRAVEAQDDVEVVDHQVEDDVDVEAAGRERAQPVDLDEARAARRSRAGRRPRG